MKKIFSMILCLILLLSFVSCGKSAENFAMPQKTDELVIYHNLHPAYRQHFDTALTLFKGLYPDIKVTMEEIDLFMHSVTKMSDDQWMAAEEDATQRVEVYRNRLLTELMAGSGPDIFLFPQDGLFGDIEKVMDIDVFEDLNPYFEQDETFSYDDFVGGVFDAGVRGDRRLFVPLNYDVPMRLTSLEALERWKVDYSEDMSRKEYETVLRQVYTQIAEDNNRWLTIRGFGSDFGYYLSVQAGFRYIDYEESEVVIDSAQLKEFMDTFAPFDRLYKERTQNEIVQPYFDQGFGYADALLDGALFEVSYDDSYYGMDMLPIEYYRLLVAGQTPVFHNLPRVDDENAIAYAGTCAAVGKNSNNKANAYEFLKVLLSDDAYVQENNFKTPIPVRKQSIERLVAAAVDSFVRDETPQEIWDDDYTPKYLSAIQDVSLVYRNSDVLKIVEETVMPYIEGTKPYEECFEELEERLNFYLSE